MTERAGPLAGWRILVTRPAGTEQPFMAQLEQLGAEAVACPAISLVPASDPRPVDDAIERLAVYDWLVFTSANGVRFFAERMAQAGRDTALPEHLRCAAIGPATAAAAGGQGWPVSYVPGEYVGEALGEGLPDVEGRRVLLPRADIAREELAVALRRRGALVDEIVAYETVAAQDMHALEQTLGSGRLLHALTFASPSAVAGLIEAAGPLLDWQLAAGAKIACIGPITAAAARAAGMPVHAVAMEYNMEGLLRALVALRQKERE